MPLQSNGGPPQPSSSKRDRVGKDGFKNIQADVALDVHA